MQISLSTLRKESRVNFTPAYSLREPTCCHMFNMSIWSFRVEVMRCGPDRMLSAYSDGGIIKHRMWLFAVLSFYSCMNKIQQGVYF